jgi:hypothetical protein
MLQPCAHRVDRLMHPQTQLRLDGVKRRPHPLGHSPTAYNEVAFGVRRTVVREPKKRERLRFSLATLFPRRRANYRRYTLASEENLGIKRYFDKVS